jgi:hypothetical protein
MRKDTPAVSQTWAVKLFTFVNSQQETTNLPLTTNNLGDSWDIVDNMALFHSSVTNGSIKMSPT